MATWWCCRYPRPAGPAREPRRPLTPAAGEEEGSRRRKLSRKRARRPHFPGGSGGRGGAASGAGEPPPPGWGECAAPRVGKHPGAWSPAPVLAFVSGAQPEPDTVRWAERLSGVAARVPPPLPCPSPAANCLHRAGLGTEKEVDGGDQRRQGGRCQVRREVFSCRPSRLAGWPGFAEEGARVGMNGPPLAGRSGRALAAAPCPTCLARPEPRSPLGLRSGARPASSLNLEALRRKARAGDSGWLRRPSVRYCSRSDSRSPRAGPRVQARPLRACDCLTLPAPRLSCVFSRRCSRRAGRRDAGVRQTWGSWDFGGREDADPRRGPGLHRPQPQSTRVGTRPSPPSFCCRLGQVCACG